MSGKVRVALLAPTRMGKTTLVTAMLAESGRQLAGTGVSLVPTDATERVIAANRNAITGALTAGKFEAGAIVPNMDMRIYSLELRAGPRECRVEVPLEILDYPGGWLSPEYRSRNPEAADEWERCQDHIEQSTVVLVPIDAARIMEARTAGQKALVPGMLEVATVAQNVSAWLKGREEYSGEPAVVILVPVKCETYFNDNGVQRPDRSGELRTRVRDVYQELIDGCQQAARPVRLLYAPIDTFGCVELMDARWVVDGDERNVEMRFKVRGERRLRPKGADTVLREVCRALVAVEEAEQAVAAATAGRDREELQRRLGEPKGLLSSLVFRISGERRQVIAGIGVADRLAQDAERRQHQLQEAVRRIAAAPVDSRVEDWSVRV